MNFLKIIINELHWLFKNEKEFNYNKYDVGDVVWAKMPLSQEELNTIPKEHQIRPYLIINIDEENKNYSVLKFSSRIRDSKFKDLHYIIDFNQYAKSKINLSDVNISMDTINDNLICDYYLKLNEKDCINIAKKMLIRLYYDDNNDFRKTQFFKKYKDKFKIEVGDIVHDNDNNRFYVNYADKDVTILFAINNCYCNNCLMIIPNTFVLYDKKIQHYDKGNLTVDWTCSSNIIEKIKKKHNDIFRNEEMVKMKKKKDHKDIEVGSIIKLNNNSNDYIVLVAEKYTLLLANLCGIISFNSLKMINRYNYDLKVVGILKDNEVLEILKKIKPYLGFINNEMIMQELDHQEFIIRERNKDI